MWFLGALAALLSARSSAAQEVEIISGTAHTWERSGAGGAEVARGSSGGIRVIAWVRLDPPRTHLTTLEPLFPTEIARIQEALAAAGADPGVPDGRLGPRTRRALGRFQRDRGLAVCGCPDYDTIRELGLAPLVVQTVIGPREDAPAVEVLMPAGLPARRGETREPAVRPDSVASPPDGVAPVVVGFALPLTPFHGGVAAPGDAHGSPHPARPAGHPFGNGFFRAGGPPSTVRPVRPPS